MVLFFFKVSFVENEAMAIISVTTTSLNTSLTASGEIVSKAQVITWSFALALEAVVIVVGNLLAIVLFASNKKLRTNCRYGFLASLTHYRCFDICREILRQLLAAEAPNTYYASIQVRYFDGVDSSNSYSHGLSSAILHPTGCVYFRIFLRLVSSSHNLWF